MDNFNCRSLKPENKTSHAHICLKDKYDYYKESWGVQSQVYAKVSVYQCTPPIDYVVDRLKRGNNIAR